MNTIRSWLQYDKRHLPGDLVAGITVATMLVPQSMAYALLAGLPPVAGLYASILPVLIYGLLASSHVLTVGPTAITSVMVLGSLDQFADGEQYLGLALTLALTLGFVYLVMGTLRLGVLVNLLSQPVLAGYVNAAACIIAISQIQHFIGVEVERSSRPLMLLWQSLRHIGTLNISTTAIGLLCMLVLLFFKFRLGRILRRHRVSPLLTTVLTRSGPLFVVAIGTMATLGLSLHQRANIAIIGEIPRGFPTLSLNRFDFSHLDVMFTGAVAIAFVGFMEGVSTAKSLVSQRRQRINANQELVAMGAANLASAVSGGFPVTTSISRSAVNHAAGANTGLSSVIAAVALALTVMLFTPLFYYLPQATLAAVILVAVTNLVDFSSVLQLWRYSKYETLPFVVTFVSVFFVDILGGILLGMAMAAVLHLLRTSRPYIAVLGRIGNSTHFRDVCCNDDSETYSNMLILRVDASLYFANAQFLENYLRRAIADYPTVDYLILDCSAINSIDASALQILTDLVHEFEEADIQIIFTELKERVYSRLRRVDFVDRVGVQHFFQSTHDAVIAFTPQDQPPVPAVTLVSDMA